MKTVPPPGLRALDYLGWEHEGQFQDRDTEIEASTPFPGIATEIVSTKIWAY